MKKEAIDTNTFHLQGKSISYIITLNEVGDLFHYHFGNKIADRDYSRKNEKFEFSWISYDENNVYLETVRWHDLRHTTASMLMLKGWQMKEISEWLGHSDIGTTMNIYAHINMEHKKILGNTLNGLFA